MGSTPTLQIRGRPGGTTLRLLLAACTLALLAAAGCRDDPTGPGERVVRLQLVEPGPDTVVAGSDSSSSLRVRALEAGGAPVEGLEVRFVVLSGGGSVAPGVAETDGAGEAEAAYVPGPSPGTAALRVYAPGALDAAPVIREIVQRPSRRLIVERVEGGDQEAEVGSQLPLPFRVRVTRASGQPAANERILWQLVDAPDGAELDPLAARTDSAGQAGALLTLGETSGIHRVRVHGTGSVATDTIVFIARSVASLDSDVHVDSVLPLPLEPGGEATVFGRGFPAGAGVRVEARSAEVLEASEGRIRVRVPEAEECRPDRTAGVRVVSGQSLSNGLSVGLQGTGTRLDLTKGEIQTLTAAQAGCVQLPARAEGRSLRLVVQSTARSGAGQTALEVLSRAGRRPGSGTAPAASSAAPGTGARDPGARAPAMPGVGGGVSPWDRSAGASGPLQIQSRARRELRRVGARPARPPATRDPGPGLPVGRTPPVDPGDILDLHFAVDPDLSVSCADTTGGVSARVRAREPSVVLAEDTAAGTGFTDQEHALLAREFDELVFPTDTAYFGAPSDLDGNGRVVVLFTHRVNELTPRGADAAVGGFFLPLDLAEAGDGDEAGVPGPGGEVCPASNEAEILYLPVPDPRGVHGPEFSRSEALRNARGIVAHELMHLVSASQRVVEGDRGFLALEEVWLGEALSHLAEEVVGFRFLGMEPGGGLDFGDFTGSRKGIEAFNTFHLQNFGRLQLYLLEPAATPALSLADPGGLPSLRMRGFGWLFARWMADRFGTPGDEADFVRRLSVGGPSRLSGIDNITAATGSAWEDLLESFALVPLLGGTDMPAASGGSASRRNAAELATWDLDETYEGLGENPGSRSLFPLGYPLRVTALSPDDGPRGLSLHAASSAYFALGGVTRSPAVALALRDGAGSSLGEGTAVRVILARVR